MDRKVTKIEVQMAKDLARDCRNLIDSFYKGYPLVPKNKAQGEYYVDDVVGNLANITLTETMLRDLGLKVVHGQQAVYTQKLSSLIRNLTVEWDPKYNKYQQQNRPSVWLESKLQKEIEPQVLKLAQSLQK